MEVRPKWTEEELDIIFSKAEHPWGWEVDHIKPISEGGTNELSNLRPLNISDNRGRNN